MVITLGRGRIPGEVQNNQTIMTLKRIKSWEAFNEDYSRKETYREVSGTDVVPEIQYEAEVSENGEEHAAALRLYRNSEGGYTVEWDEDDDQDCQNFREGEIDAARNFLVQKAEELNIDNDFVEDETLFEDDVQTEEEEEDELLNGVVDEFPNDEEDYDETSMESGNPGGGDVVDADIDEIGSTCIGIEDPEECADALTKDHPELRESVISILGRIPDRADAAEIVRAILESKK